MKEGKGRREYSREYKLSAARRMLAGESPSALARELGIARKLLYDWKDRYEEGGEQNLRPEGRPSRAQGAVVLSAAERTQRRVAELERLVGKQQVLIDFFELALRRVEPQTDGKAKSTKRSAKSANEPEKH